MAAGRASTDHSGSPVRDMAAGHRPTDHPGSLVGPWPQATDPLTRLSNPFGLVQLLWIPAHEPSGVCQVYPLQTASQEGAGVGRCFYTPAQPTVSTPWQPGSLQTCDLRNPAFLPLLPLIQALPGPGEEQSSLCGCQLGTAVHSWQEGPCAELCPNHLPRTQSRRSHLPLLLAGCTDKSLLASSSRQELP